jgi:hypothetical protein
MECAQPEGKCPDQELSSGEKSRFAAREYDKRPRQWIERAHFPNPLRCLSRPIGYAMRGLSPGSSLLAARLVSRVENVLDALRRFNSRLARVL